MKDLDQVKNIFLADVDEETRADNELKIREWEQALIENEAFLSWQEHDITKVIILQVRKAYKEISLNLAVNRGLTEAQRMSSWAKQDACLFLLGLAEKDAKGTLEQVTKEIKTALNASK